MSAGGETKWDFSNLGRSADVGGPQIEGPGWRPIFQISSKMMWIEGAIDGLKTSVGTMGAVGAWSVGVIAIALGLIGAVLALMMTDVASLRSEIRTDLGAVRGEIRELSAGVGELPEKMSAAIREANRAFADAVSASVQALRAQPVTPSPPIIIQIPAPLPPSNP